MKKSKEDAQSELILVNGVGGSTAQKLEDAGVTSAQALAAIDPSTMVPKTGLHLGTLVRLRDSAAQFLATQSDEPRADKPAAAEEPSAPAPSEADEKPAKEKKKDKKSKKKGKGKKDKKDKKDKKRGKKKSKKDKKKLKKGKK